MLKVITIMLLISAAYGSPEVACNATASDPLQIAILNAINDERSLQPKPLPKVSMFAQLSKLGENKLLPQNLNIDCPLEPTGDYVNYHFESPGLCCVPVPYLISDYRHKCVRGNDGQANGGVTDDMVSFIGVVQTTNALTIDNIKTELIDKLATFPDFDFILHPHLTLFAVGIVVRDRYVAILATQNPSSEYIRCSLSSPTDSPTTSTDKETTTKASTDKETTTQGATSPTETSTTTAAATHLQIPAIHIILFGFTLVYSICC